MNTAAPLLRQSLFGWANFALTAPGIYLWIGLPLIMRQHGWSGTEIGLFQLAGLPAVFKLFLALPVERRQRGRRPLLYWAWLTGSGYLLALLGLSALDADSHKASLFALMFLASLFATWADIPVSALAIGLFPPKERPLAGGVRSAVTFAGVVVGGGLMLLVEQALGWAAPFLILGGCLFSALVLLALIRETAASPDRWPLTRNTPARHVWQGFFQQAGTRIWSIVLLGHFPFVAAAWVYLKPLLLDQGVPAGEVALIAGVGGGALGALASLVTGFAPRRHMAQHLPLSAIANAAVLALMALTAAHASGPWLVSTAILLAIAMGASSALVLALMMEFARDAWRAADYGLQASLFALGRIPVAMLAGWLLDRFGYPGMLAALAVAALLIALLISPWRGSGISLSKGVTP